MILKGIGKASSVEEAARTSHILCKTNTLKKKKNKNNFKLISKTPLCVFTFRKLGLDTTLSKSWEKSKTRWLFYRELEVSTYKKTPRHIACSKPTIPGMQAPKLSSRCVLVAKQQELNLPQIPACAPRATRPMGAGRAVAVGPGTEALLVPNSLLVPTWNQ